MYSYNWLVTYFHNNPNMFDSRGTYQCSQIFTILILILSELYLPHALLDFNQSAFVMIVGSTLNSNVHDAHRLSNTIQIFVVFFQK